jgi:hypothetical protein
MATSVATTANVNKFLVTKTSHNLRHCEARLRLFHNSRITCYEYLEPSCRHKRRGRVKRRQYFRRDDHPNMNWRIFVAYCSSRGPLIALKSAPTPRYRSAMSLGEGSSSSHQ